MIQKKNMFLTVESETVAPVAMKMAVFEPATFWPVVSGSTNYATAN
jgi:hypothetical protein